MEKIRVQVGDSQKKPGAINHPIRSGRRDQCDDRVQKAPLPHPKQQRAQNDQGCDVELKVMLELTGLHEVSLENLVRVDPAPAENRTKTIWRIQHSPR